MPLSLISNIVVKRAQSWKMIHVAWLHIYGKIHITWNIWFPTATSVQLMVNMIYVETIIHIMTLRYPFRIFCRLICCQVNMFDYVHDQIYACCCNIAFCLFLFVTFKNLSMVYSYLFPCFIRILLTCSILIVYNLIESAILYWLMHLSAFFLPIDAFNACFMLNSILCFQFIFT